MGAYVNPKVGTKENWLEVYATPCVTIPIWKDIPDGHLAVCLVNNGYFTAGAIAYSERELEEFKNPRDGRPKKWFLCNTEMLHTVSLELKNYLDSVK